MNIKRKAGLIFTTLLTLTLFTFLAKNPAQVKSLASHVVISEVQIAGSGATEDFVELYNPTSTQVDLSDYRLVKRTSTGSSDGSIVAFQSGDVIEPYGFFLWCNNEISESLSCDKNTAATVSNNNSVGLRDGPMDTGTLIDAVTFGTVENPLGEGTSVDPAPDANQSVERKASATSTSVTMGPGGSEETSGNGEDTDNNSADFYLRTTPDSQNSSSSAENPGTAPTPTVEPTPIPSLEPTLTETPFPSPTPTVKPTPTPEPTPTGRIIARFGLSGRIRLCTINYEMFKIGFLRVFFPRISCTRV